MCSAAQCGSNLISARATSKKDVLSGNAAFIQLPPTPVTNHSALCFSWLLPPNILVRMMMSDRDFYISPQLASHPCSPSTCTIGGGLTHAHQSLTSLFPLPPPARNPPPLASGLTGLLPPVSEPAAIILNVPFPFFNCRLRLGTEKSRKCKTHHMPESNQHISIL